VRQDFDRYKIVMGFPAFFHYIRRLNGKKMKLGCGGKCRQDTSLSTPSLFGAL
jgi:hypothetical protein